jgi:hypothetical protein
LRHCDWPAGLWYDSDGKKGLADAVHLATITNKAALSISDFELF